MRCHREGKITLRTHTIEDLPPLEVDADLIRKTRERFHVSRAVFARRLRVSTRTVENWEQRRARPNAQAAALILMVQKYPDTFKRLQSLEYDSAARLICHRVPRWFPPLPDFRVPPPPPG